MGEALIAVVLLTCGALLIAAAVGVAIVLGGVQRERREALVAVLRELGASDVRARGASIDAIVQRTPVCWQMIPGGRGSPPHTLCHAGVEAPQPFELELRRQTAREIQQVRAGRAVDVIVGDALFDDAFIVEAAPSLTARALLDAPTRSALLALQPERVWIAKGRLWLDVLGVVQDARVARAMLELLVAMAQRLAELPRALADSQLAAAREMPDAGYRGPTAEAMAALEWSPTAEREIAALLDARSRRARRVWTLVAIGVALWLAAALLPLACGR